MPNAENIRRPIVFLGLGRSGTSAVTQILGTHPEIDTVGEVSPILFDVHWGVNLAMNNMRFPSPVEGQGGRLELPGSAVREFFLRNFHSDKKAWVIKPIGLIGRIKDIFQHRSSDANFVSWCFNVLFECFPEAQIYTIVRDPLSYARSARRYWASPVEGVANDVAFMSLLLASGKIQPDRVYKFAEFVANRRGILDTIVANAGLEAHMFNESDLGMHYAAEQGGSTAIPPFSPDEISTILRNVGASYEPFLDETRTFVPDESAPDDGEQQDYADMYKRLSAEFLFLQGQVGGLQQLANQKEESIQKLIGWNKILEDKTIRFANALLEHGIPVPSDQ
jgi:hypothetical protein